MGERPGTGSRVLVTGASGFVGRELVCQLASRGHRVIALDAASTGPAPNAVTVAGSLADPEIRARALGQGIDALIHLASLPGGAAEADPARSRAINVDAMHDLLEEAAAVRPGLRVVFASSIAVFGEPLPAKVDDATPHSPRLVYGVHKAMMEQAVAMLSSRGAIDGVSLRLPGVLARPRGASGMKSAFMSDLFHALKFGERFVCPVSPAGTVWAESLVCCAGNLAHALVVDAASLPPGRAITLPALRIAMGDLANEIARQCGADPALVEWQPDAALEAAFGAQPPLATPAADVAGFAHDGDLATLVASALKTMA